MSDVRRFGLSCRGVGKTYSVAQRAGGGVAECFLRRCRRRVRMHRGSQRLRKIHLAQGILAGLVEPSSGQLSFGSGAGRPANALVFQEHGLFPWMSVLDNVAFGLEMQGIATTERRARALDFLGQYGLAAFAGNLPHELSVGMRQRAAIARAFLCDPEVLLMDEPFSALDAQSKLVLEEELLRIWRDHRKTVVYVTHDIEEAVLLGDRVLVMTGHPGRIREDIPIPLGRPRDLRDREQSNVREITWRIWKMIEGEVRTVLSAAQ